MLIIYLLCNTLLASQHPIEEMAITDEGHMYIGASIDSHTFAPLVPHPLTIDLATFSEEIIHQVGPGVQVQLFNCDADNMKRFIEAVPKDSITHIEIRDPFLTDTGLSYLTQLTNVTHAVFMYVDISNHGLKYLYNWPYLTELSLIFTDITDNGLRHLINCQNLKYLSFSGSPIKGERELHHFAKLINLRSLDLSFTRITKAGVSRLPKLEKLTQLNIEGTPAEQELKPRNYWKILRKMCRGLWRWVIGAGI